MEIYKIKKFNKYPLRKKTFSFLFLLIFLIFFFLTFTAIAGSPRKAHYSEDSSDLYWFLIISDTHIGKHVDNSDIKDLKAVVEDLYKIINPRSIINTGDLTDQLNPKTSGEEQWEEYRQIVDTAGMNEIVNGVPVYSDAPGNHDQYFERFNPLNNYKEYSVQGRATKGTQRSWVNNKPTGKDHFITISTPDPRLTNPVTDALLKCPGDLDDEELNFIQTSLENEGDANLAFVFGHHPLRGDWGAINGGRDEFINLLCDHRASMYVFGHTHRGKTFIEPYFEICPNSVNQFLALNVSSLSEDNEFAIVAIDNDGISLTLTNLYQINPIVLITAPLDKNLGGNNPYAYQVPIGTKNPIRALVFSRIFDVTQVRYRVDSGDWYPMSQSPSNTHLWETNDWDTTSLDPSIEHTLWMQGCTTLGCSLLSLHIITFEVGNP